jgi:hypothetical protein
VDRLSLARRRFFVAFARAVKIKRRNKIINQTLESGSSLPEPSISLLIDSRIVMALFKCLNLPMKYKNSEAERENL